MIELNGKYTTAKIFTDNVENTAIGQIIELCNQSFMKDSQVRIMPDVHAGKGCTIGTTMTITDKIVPNLVGVDIGCGVLVQPIEVIGELDWIKDFDHQVQRSVPSGMNIRKTNHMYLKNVDLNSLKCIKAINLDRAEKSLGTLGGGNHYIEVNQDEENNLYLVVHSGSRYLGKQIAEYYQDLAFKTLLEDNNEVKLAIEEAIKFHKANNSEKQISSAIAKIKAKLSKQINKDLAYLEGQNMKDYLHDMAIAQHYAFWNRKAIAHEIITHMQGKIVAAPDMPNRHWFNTTHNYIDMENMVLRKGAIAARQHEIVVIPINMRDGSIIARGKGNADWNQSAPHGAGRIMSRGQAKDNVSLEEFKLSMAGIHSTSVKESTIDESPMVYKPIEEILNNIQDTVEIVKIIKPIYNYKAH